MRWFSGRSPDLHQADSRCDRPHTYGDIDRAGAAPAGPDPACPSLEGIARVRKEDPDCRSGASQRSHGVAALGATTFANGPALTGAGSANTKTAGISLPDKIAPQWRETTVAQGSNALENPSALTSWYGYYNDGPMVPAPGDVQATGQERRGRARASRTRTPTSSSRASTAPTRSTTTARTSSTRATSSEPAAATSRASTSMPTPPIASPSSPRPSPTARRRCP